MNSPITFCIGTCNNNSYLKLAIDSVRKYSYFKDAPFIIFAENCNKDDTYNWLNQNKDKYNLIIIIENNEEEKIKGIGGSMNICAKHVKTEYIMFLHADMVVSEHWDRKLLEVFEGKSDAMWVNPYRFQPNCFNENDRPGTAFFDYSEFGYKHDDFKEDYFIQCAKQFSENNPDIQYNKGEGVSGLIRKSDWDYIGGNDVRYSPAYWEDTDIFLRCQLANFKFITTTNSVVWHFGSRSGNSNFPNDTIIRSEISKQNEQNSAKQFFNKWGFWPVQNEHGFVTFPPNIDKEKYKHLIKL